jgi:hypothetical protein
MPWEALRRLGFNAARRRILASLPSPGRSDHRNFEVDRRHGQGLPDLSKIPLDRDMIDVTPTQALPDPQTRREAPVIRLRRGHWASIRVAHSTPPSIPGVSIRAGRMPLIDLGCFHRRGRRRSSTDAVRHNPSIPVPSLFNAATTARISMASSFPAAGCRSQVGAP